jgi:hypothetical protein
MANTTKFKIGGKYQDIGSTLNYDEIKKIAEKTGYTPQSVRERAKAQDFGIGKGARSYTLPTPGTSTTQTPAANTPVPYNIQPGGGIDDSQSGMSQEQYGNFLYESGILKLQGDVQTELEKLRSIGLSNVASIQAGATIRSSELDNEARKYLADKDYLSKTDVAKIQAENNLRLQDIINAGLKDVESVRQQGGRDIATITGEFGVKQESERQRGQKDIAKIGSESAYRNALIGAFSF